MVVKWSVWLSSTYDDPSSNPADSTVFTLFSCLKRTTKPKKSPLENSIAGVPLVYQYPFHGFILTSDITYS